VLFWEEVAEELRELNCRAAADALEQALAENADDNMQMAASADHLLYSVHPNMRHSHPEQALAIYNRVLEIDPQRLDALLGRAEVLFTQGLWPEALDSVDLIPEDRTVAHSSGWFTRGQILRRAGRLQRALECYSRALVLGPWVEEWRRELADLLTQLGRDDEAHAQLAAADLIAGLHTAGHARRTTAPASYEAVLDYFERALTLQPALRFAAGEIAATLLALGRPEEALARLDVAQSQAPEDVYLWAIRGAALVAAGRLEESLAAFDEAIALAPTNVAMIGKARALVRLGHLEEALTLVEEATEWDDEDEAAWALRSELLARLGQTEKALAAIEVALEWEDLLSLEDHIELVSKNLAVQGTRLRQALDWDDYLDVYRARASLLRELGREEEASSMERIVGRLEAKLYHQAGQHHLREGRYAEAIIEFDQALSFAPTWSEVWLAKADALVTLGRMDEALVAFGESMKQDIDSLREVYNRANTFTNQQEYAPALPLADAALVALPSWSHHWPSAAEISPEYMQALLLKLKGKIFSETGRYDEALSCLNSALELSPALQTAWRQRGRVLSQMGRYQESAADFEHALELDASSSYDWHSRAYALYKCHRYEEALSAIEQAIALDPAPPVVGTKGQIYLGMGKYDEALVWLDRALEADPFDREHWRDKAAVLRHLGRLEEARLAARRAR
jgi:superkiller protein 3